MIVIDIIIVKSLYIFLRRGNGEFSSESTSETVAATIEQQMVHQVGNTPSWRSIYFANYYGPGGGGYGC